MSHLLCNHRRISVFPLPQLDLTQQRSILNDMYTNPQKTVSKILRCYLWCIDPYWCIIYDILDIIQGYCIYPSHWEDLKHNWENYSYYDLLDIGIYASHYFINKKYQALKLNIRDDKGILKFKRRFRDYKNINDELDCAFRTLTCPDKRASYTNALISVSTVCTSPLCRKWSDKFTMWDDNRDAEIDIQAIAYPGWDGCVYCSSVVLPFDIVQKAEWAKAMSHDIFNDFTEWNYIYDFSISYETMRDIEKQKYEENNQKWEQECCDLNCENYYLERELTQTKDNLSETINELNEMNNELNERNAHFQIATLPQRSEKPEEILCILQ